MIEQTTDANPELTSTETTETTSKILRLDNPEDFELISKYYMTLPEFRIKEHFHKFFVQKIQPNIQQEYNTIDDTYVYTRIESEYFNNSFNTLEEAKKAFLDFTLLVKENNPPIYNKLILGQDY